MTEWLQFWGIFAILGGIVNIIQALTGLRHISGQQILMAIRAGIDLAFIPIVLMLRDAVLSVPSVGELPASGIQALSIAFQVLPILIIIGIIAGTGTTIYKMITLREKYEKYATQKAEQ